MEQNPRTEAQLELLADSFHRTVVTVVAEAGTPLYVEDLAERLVSRGTAVVRTDDYETLVDRTATSLHHEHLPRLAAAGLVEYDSEANLVANRTAPGVAWHDGTAIEEVLAHLPGIEGDTGTVEGRQSVIEYGRQLADEAEAELFCLYVDADLLEDECVCRARAAMDRGVEVSLGSRDPAVRDLARSRLSAATVWEPQLDWLNAGTYPRVGRLVLVDRRKLMLAVLEEPDPDGTYPAETAVVGEGEDHPLVVLVRELLGSRLDHLDYQSERFRHRLPSER